MTTDLDKVEDPAKMNESSTLVYKWMVGGGKLPPNSMAFVDVSDVAKAHIIACETVGAGGNRYLTTAPALVSK